jgi:coenzyme PQQ synthesis protein D (PqqD)
MNTQVRADSRATRETRAMPNESVRFRCPANVAARVLDGEAVMIHLETGRYYSSEGFGAMLWQPLSAGVSVDRIVGRIAEQFGLSPESVQQDVHRFVTELVREELLVAAPAAAGGSTPDVGLDFATSQYTTPTLQSYRDMADLLALDPPMPSLRSTE